jgi:uncharacterized repeat protein (TIGR02543 family)
MTKQLAGVLALAVLALGMGSSTALADHQTGNVRLEVASSPSGVGTIIGNGINCGLLCSEVIPLGEDCQYVGTGGNHNQGRTLCETVYPTRTLNVQPAAGWTFTGWSGACTNATGSCTVTVTDNPTRVTANLTALAGPTGSIVAPEEGAYVRGDVTVRAEVSAPAGVKEVRFYLNNSSGALATLTAPPWEVTRDSRFFVSGDGPTTFHAVITDAADNEYTTPVRSVIVDNTAPQLTLGGIEQEAYVNDPTPTLSWEAADTTPVTFTCSVDGAPEGPCSDESSHTPAEPLADGDHAIHVKATDFVGLSTTETRRFTVDTVAPVVGFVKKPKRKSRKRKAVFGLVTDEAVRYECKLDRKPWKECGGRVKQSVKPGKHTFKVRATDLAGNTSKPKTYKFKVVR